MKKVVAIITILLSGFFVSGQSIKQNSLLWEITGPEGGVSYLFGTYHLLGSDYIKEKPNLNSVYEKSKTVVVETIIDSALLPQMAMKAMMVESIAEMVDSAEYIIISEAVEPLVGAPMSLLNNMKPMALATLISLNMAQAATPDSFQFSGMPIDQYFAAHAKKQKKEVVPLESMMEQADILLNGESVEDQLEALLYIINEKDEGRQMTQRTITAYMEEDLAAMLAISQDYEEEMGDMSAILDDRNKNWIPKLKPLLAKGSVFIAVGALHLPGEFGLIKLLEAEGFGFKALALK
ncbi:MAG: hypothetical protein ACJAZH_000766 [Roseivirga sp.]|jgi:uncharacterized protein YbaP (TraB family)